VIRRLPSAPTVSLREESVITVGLDAVKVLFTKNGFDGIKGAEFPTTPKLTGAPSGIRDSRAASFPLEMTAGFCGGGISFSSMRRFFSFAFSSSFSLSACSFSLSAFRFS